MRALAIETSGRAGSIAIAEDGRVLAHEQFSSDLRHAAELLPRIDAMTRAANWAPKDISEIYVSTGPGSFTGLRIGITLCKTLALVSGAKVVSVPTVEVLARNAPSEARELIVVLDAKRDRIFTARFSRASAAQTWSISEAAHLDSLGAMLERAARPVCLLGEGIPYHQEAIAHAADVIVTPPESWRARAEAVVEIGHAMAREGKFADIWTLAPLYIRPPEAQEKWEAMERERGEAKSI